jgi:hypothetical protein
MLHLRKTGRKYAMHTYNIFYPNIFEVFAKASGVCPKVVEQLLQGGNDFIYSRGDVVEKSLNSQMYRYPLV